MAIGVGKYDPDWSEPGGSIPEEVKKIEYYSLNFEGHLERLGEFEDFDRVEEYLLEKEKISNWIFSREALKDFLTENFSTDDILKIMLV